MARPVSPETQAIRDVLTEKGADLTFTQAQPLLAEKGFGAIADTYFYSTKQAFKAAKQTRKPRKARKVHKVRLPEVDPQEAVSFVLENGGLAKVEANIRKEQAMVRAFRAVLKSAA